MPTPKHGPKPGPKHSAKPGPNHSPNSGPERAGDDPVSSLRNIGPATEAAFTRAGITSAAQLRDLGADAAYARLLQTGQRPHFISYYVLVMALQGRPWNDCKGAEKAALRQRFDTLCATLPKPDENEKSRLQLEAALNDIGVIARPQPTSSSPAKK